MKINNKRTRKVAGTWNRSKAILQLGKNTNEGERQSGLSILPNWLKLNARPLTLSLFFLLTCLNTHNGEPGLRDGSPSTNKCVEINGTQLEYVVEGKGIPCLVIGSSVYYPKTFSQNLRNYLKMYFLDMKWFAKSYRPENLDLVNIQTIVQDVEAIRAKLGLKKPLIIGHSIHGTIAAEYVKAHADKVAGLVVIGSPCQWGNEGYERMVAAHWETASEERKKIQAENWGKVKELDRLTGKAEAAARYNNSSPQYWYDPHYDAGWLWEGMTVHSEVTRHLFTRVFASYNMFEPAKPISVPVLVAMGKYDYVIPYTLWQTRYESIPDFTLVLFEKSGHTPQLEESQLFDQKLTDWLGQRL
jgi:proline iminopeptidase